MNNIFPTNKILNNTGLFWQYPVITEQEFFNQNKDDLLFIGFPWATLIDKNIAINQIARLLIPHIKHKNYYTCCQHINFRDYISLFKSLNINIVFTPHKIIGEDTINGVTIKPCPLYAVNIEDKERNMLFQDNDFMSIERDLLYSFICGFQFNYLSNIRNDIFKLNHPEDALVKNTGQWHFNNLVYSNKQNKQRDLNVDNNHIDATKNYNNILLRSRYSLCPSGSGPNSIRFWESLACGSIPVLLADTLELPGNIEWSNAIVFIKEKDIGTLEDVLRNIPHDREIEMRKKCIDIYKVLSKNYKNGYKNIVHYCCGSYEIGDFGGVARYDYHIKKAFPNRLFLQGPRQYDVLLQTLPFIKDLLVITDNHLSCDIPNNIQTLLVHHGSALTHAEREPQWSKYWKDLCCDGQKKMLSYRDTTTTTIVSISKFCTDEFTRFFHNQYLKFNNELILHTSELDENVYKTSFNVKPIVLGNWSGFLKGQHIIDNLINKTNDFDFKQLNIRFNKDTHKTFDKYNFDKQKIYCESDIFLQLSICEGNSLATLDAFLCGNVVVATNVGLTYKDVPDNCFVKLDYKRVNDVNYVLSKLKYAWEHKEELSKNAREFYLNELNFELWRNKMIKITL